MKIKGNWGFLEMFISGLSTLIFINYLITGFRDVVININNFLTWWQHTNLSQLFNQFLK